MCVFRSVHADASVAAAAVSLSGPVKTHAVLVAVDSAFPAV